MEAVKHETTPLDTFVDEVVKSGKSADELLQDDSRDNYLEKLRGADCTDSSAAA